MLVKHLKNLRQLKTIGSFRSFPTLFSQQFEVNQQQKLRRFISTKVYFDTRELATKLEKTGLSPEQSSVICQNIAEVLHTCIDSATKTYTPLQDHKQFQYKTQTDFNALKSEILQLEKSHYENALQENRNTVQKVEKFKDQLRNEISTLRGGMQLDMNLEKTRIGSQIQGLEGSVERLKSTVETEHAILNSKVAEVKFEVLKYCFATIASLAALGLGWLRFQTK